MRQGWSKRSAALGETAPGTRGTRWLLRQSGTQPASFDALAAVPAWVGWEAAEQRRLSLAVALLHHRPQLDRELRSEVLAPLAALTGERLFDALCTAPVSGQAEAEMLPPTVILSEQGKALVDAAAADDPYAATLTGQAASLLDEEVAA